jgi:hypothetical protein
MAISYPLSLPTTIGIANIELTATNAVAISRSQFTFAQQVHIYPGQMWSASVSLPPLRREFIEPWVSMLLALRGQAGTFLLGDPNCKAPRGTATSATVSGTSGSASVSITMTGTLLAGDYIQLGSGASATLHKVLIDKTNSGTLEIWPALRRNFSGSAVLTNTVGLFRLATNQQSWSINESSAYGLSFEAMEVV